MVQEKINKLDYSSYRVPFIDEFINGFEYEYVYLSISKNYEFKVGQICETINGLKGIITEIYKEHNCADIDFFNYPKTRFYCLSWLKKPTCKETTTYWRKGIWGTPFGIQKKEYLKEMIENDNVITKGKILSYHDKNKNNDYPWIVVTCPGTEYYCKSILLKSKMKTHQEYLDSLEEEKEQSKEFWSSIKKNLEVKPMKSNNRKKKEKRTFRFKLIGLIKGEGEWKVLFETAKRLNYYDNEQYNLVLKTQINNIDHSEILQLKLIKTYSNNKTEVKQLKVKTKSQATHSNYVPKKRREFSVSYASQGYLDNGLPNFEITKRIYGTSIKNALNRYKIQFNKVTCIREVFHSTRKDPEIITHYKRKLPLTKSKSKNVIKAEKSSRIKRIKLENKEILRTKYKANTDKKVCIRYKDTIDVRRIWRSELANYDMTEWNFCAKSAYKRLKGKSIRISEPKEVNVKVSNFVNKHRNNREKVEITRTIPNGEEHYKEVKCNVYKYNKKTQEEIDNCKKLRPRVIWRINDKNLSWSYLKRLKKLRKKDREEYDLLIMKMLKDNRIDIIPKGSSEYISLKESVIPFTNQDEKINPPLAKLEKQVEKGVRRLNKKKKSEKFKGEKIIIIRKKRKTSKGHINNKEKARRKQKRIK